MTTRMTTIRIMAVFRPRPAPIGLSPCSKSSIPVAWVLHPVWVRVQVSGYPPSVRTHYRLARPKRIWGNLPAFGPLASLYLVLFDEERPPFDGDLPAEGIVIAADVAHHQPPAVEGHPTRIRLTGDGELVAYPPTISLVEVVSTKVVFFSTAR